MTTDGLPNCPPHCMQVLLDCVARRQIPLLKLLQSEPLQMEASHLAFQVGGGP